ncbi:MAG: hypothetical protein OSA81_03430 [Longimicrobiales bacterium]|nr:hypothetical protein [Longimicrobiales bacterium]
MSRSPQVLRITVWSHAAAWWISSTGVALLASIQAAREALSIKPARVLE